MTDVLGRLTAALADRYVIERELGAGGMATVYLAHDVRHDRQVALKVLRPELASILGAERFLTEIKTTANLQHPHILSLFDSGEADGLVFYVMPYVEGESLRDRLTREKQLPVEEAVRIAVEVAGALDYAHRHGVVHRDIKPENILLHEGQALVADFGIALAASRSNGGTRMTETGMSLGTPHYMAPEQAMGEKEITPKADVYALGCVLYEMLTAEPPFTGATAQAIIARVMTEEPRSLTLQRRTIPPHVEAAVRKALEKLPADRFTTAGQFAEALTHPGSLALTAVPGASPVGASAVAKRRTALRAGAGAVALLALGAALGWWLRPRPVAALHPVVRFGIQLPRDAEPVGATGSIIAVSPDGSRIVYVGKAASGQRLYVRGMDQVEPVPVAGSDGGILPFFSPDGRWLGFKQGDHLVKVALAGGPVVSLCDAGGATYGATWTPGDTIIFASDAGLMEVPAAGGTAHLLAKADSGVSYLWPDEVNGGRAVLFTVMDHAGVRLAALIRRSRKIKRFSQAGGYPHYVSAGFVVLADGAGLISAVPFDVRRLEVTGAAVPVVDKVSMNPNGDQNFGISRTGAFAYQPSFATRTRLVLVDRSGAVRDVGADTGLYETPRLAADGRRVAMVRYTDDNFDAGNVWIFDLAQHTRTRLTFDTLDYVPAWSPDGRRIAYARGAGTNATRLDWVPADGSGTPDSLPTPKGLWLPAAFEPDARGLVVHGVGPSATFASIWRVPVGGSGTPHQVLAGAFNEYDPSLSPDGRWMAYMSSETGRPEVYVRPYPGPGGRWQVSLDGGTEPVWSPTGREIFYRSGDQMMAAAVRTAGSFAVGSRAPLFEGDFGTTNQLVTDYDVTRDGKAFIMLQPVQSAAQSIYVTLNWFEAQRRTK